MLSLGGYRAHQTWSVWGLHARRTHTDVDLAKIRHATPVMMKNSSSVMTNAKLGTLDLTCSVGKIAPQINTHVETCATLITTVKDVQVYSLNWALMLSQYSFSLQIRLIMLLSFQALPHQSARHDALLRAKELKEQTN